MMLSNGSVSHWIVQLKAGNQAAAQELWEDYFQRLVRLARRRLRGRSRRAADEEDVALSAFDSFCRGAEQGRFPRLTDRDNLWRLLVVITAPSKLLFIMLNECYYTCPLRCYCRYRLHLSQRLYLSFLQVSVFFSPLCLHLHRPLSHLLAAVSKYFQKAQYPLQRQLPHSF